jgi:DNA recombination protein RmuC
MGLQNEYQMSKETINLTKALKGDSKMMQNSGANSYWNVCLKKIRFRKGREYEVQQLYNC